MLVFNHILDIGTCSNVTFVNAGILSPLTIPTENLGCCAGVLSISVLYVGIAMSGADIIPPVFTSKIETQLGLKYVSH